MTYIAIYFPFSQSNQFTLHARSNSVDQIYQITISGAFILFNKELFIVYVLYTCAFVLKNVNYT